MPPRQPPESSHPKTAQSESAETASYKALGPEGQRPPGGRKMTLQLRWRHSEESKGSPRDPPIVCATLGLMTRPSWAAGAACTSPRSSAALLYLRRFQVVGGPARRSCSPSASRAPWGPLRCSSRCVTPARPELPQGAPATTSQEITQGVGEKRRLAVLGSSHLPRPRGRTRR